MFAGFVDKNFDFQIIRDVVTQVLTNNEDPAEAVKQVMEGFLNKERGDYKRQLQDFSDQILEWQNKYNTFYEYARETIEQKISDNEGYRQKILYLTELIQISNRILSRIHNGTFEVCDLHIISGFTLYQRDGNVLNKIADIGTSAASDKRIPLSSKRHQNWAVVKAATSGTYNAWKNKPSPDRLIVSFALQMDRGITWVYNFHIDESTNAKAVALTAGDEVETRILYNLVHVACKHLQRTGLYRKGGKRHAIR